MNFCTSHFFETCSGCHIACRRPRDKRFYFRYFLSSELFQTIFIILRKPGSLSQLNRPEETLHDDWMLIFEKGSMNMLSPLHRKYSEREKYRERVFRFPFRFSPSLSSRLLSSSNPHEVHKKVFLVNKENRFSCTLTISFRVKNQPQIKLFFLFSTHLVPVGSNSIESRNVHSNSSQSEMNIKLWIYLLRIGNRKQPSFTWLAYFLCHGSILFASFALENFQGMSEAAHGTAQKLHASLDSGKPCCFNGSQAANQQS